MTTTSPPPQEPPPIPADVGSLSFERAPGFAAVIDPSLTLVRTNAAFRERFGAREGEPCHVVLKHRDAPCDECAVARTFSDGAEHVSEERGQTVDDRELTYRTRTIPIPGPDGTVALVLQMATDTTRLLDLEHALDQAEKLARVGLTMAGMAHTIKNILAGLEGGTYMVRSGLERDNHQRVVAGWGMVEKYIEQIGTLVHNLLRYTREDEAPREVADPGELAHDVAELYRSKAEMAYIELVVEVDDGLAPVEIDRGAIHASLANLVTNALDACQWDPAEDKEHRVTISARSRAGGGCTLAVEDNGMGISPENQARVLASSFTTKGIRGTGLGLLLSKKAVEQHGGEMSFSSQEGLGSTFRIDLPGRAARDTGGEAP